MGIIEVKRPETITAVLSSEGFPDGRATIHRYVRTERVQLKHWPRIGDVFVFRCSQTGAERVYGCE